METPTLFILSTGLVDSESQEDLEVKLQSLEEKWKKIEKTFLPSEKEPGFYKYIKERVSVKSLLYRESLKMLLTFIWLIQYVGRHDHSVHAQGNKS